MAVPAVQVQGLNDWRKEIKAVDGALPKALGKAHQEIGRVIEPAARTLSGTLGLHHRQSAAGAIRSAAQQRGVVLTARASAAIPWALGVIMGQDTRSGWYTATKYSGSTGRQFPPHIGQDWEVGGPGGPRMNDAIRDSLPVIEVLLDKALTDLTARAFPD